MTGLPAILGASDEHYLASARGQLGQDLLFCRLLLDTSSIADQLDLAGIQESVAE